MFYRSWLIEYISNYRCTVTSVALETRLVRASVLLIQQSDHRTEDEKLVGKKCVNFDDQYQDELPNKKTELRSRRLDGKDKRFIG